MVTRQSLTDDEIRERVPEARAREEQARAKGLRAIKDALDASDQEKLP